MCRVCLPNAVGSVGINASAMTNLTVFVTLFPGELQILFKQCF